MKRLVANGERRIAGIASWWRPTLALALTAIVGLYGPAAAQTPKTKALGGAKLGMIIGGAVGAGSGVVLGLVANTLDDDKLLNDTGDWAVWVGSFTLAGAVTGALLGALVGSTQANDAGFDQQPRFRIGLEHDRLITQPHVYSTALTARVAPTPGLHLLGALGDNHWSHGQNLPAASLGVSLETTRPHTHSSWLVEGRYHFTLQRDSDEAGSLRLATLAVVRRFG